MLFMLDVLGSSPSVDLPVLEVKTMRVKTFMLCMHPYGCTHVSYSGCARSQPSCVQSHMHTTFFEPDGIIVCT